jgi:hypothetical protein
MFTNELRSPSLQCSEFPVNNLECTFQQLDDLQNESRLHTSGGMTYISYKLRHHLYHHYIHSEL